MNMYLSILAVTLQVYTIAGAPEFFRLADFSSCGSCDRTATPNLCPAAVTTFFPTEQGCKDSLTFYEIQGVSKTCVSCTPATCAFQAKKYKTLDECNTAAAAAQTSSGGAGPPSPSTAAPAATAAPTAAATAGPTAPPATPKPVKAVVFHGIQIPPPGFQIPQVAQPKPAVHTMTHTHAVQHSHKVQVQPTHPPVQHKCQDKDHECVAFAQRGECTINPVWMLPNCAKSCGKCGTPAVGTTRSQIIIEPTRPPLTGCVDRDHECAAFARRGECNANPVWMNPNCPKSCNKCGLKIIEPMPRPQPEIIIEPQPRPQVIIEPQPRPQPEIIIEPQPRPQVIIEPKPRPQVIIEPVPRPQVLIEPTRKPVKPVPYMHHPKPSGYSGHNPKPKVLPAVQPTRSSHYSG